MVCVGANPESTEVKVHIPGSHWIDLNPPRKLGSLQRWFWKTKVGLIFCWKYRSGKVRREDFCKFFFERRV